MWKTKRAAMTLAVGLLLLLFSTAFAAAPTQTSMSRTASAPTTPQQPQAVWSGWSQVPGNGFTVSGPATTFYHGNDYDYVFVRGTNDRIYANSFNGTTWSGWSEVPGNGSTLSGPTSANYLARGAMFLSLFVRGINDHLYVNTLGGTTWSGWSEVPGNGLTPSAPAATLLTINITNTLYLFVRGTNNKIYTNTFNGASWGGWSEVPGHGFTPDAPGVDAFQVSKFTVAQMYLLVRGTNDRIYLNILPGA